MSLVVPAVLPSSKADLEEKLALFAEFPGVSRIQIDTVDGTFASPASWPVHVLPELHLMVEKSEMLPRLDHVAYEIDLMCLDAESLAESWLSLGATHLIFHAETATDLPHFFSFARAHYGELVTLGVALNLDTELSTIEPVLASVAYVQFMGIAKIGRQGEPLDPRVYGRLKTFRARYPDMPVQVDGGVTLGNAPKLLALGATNLVVGSGILRAADPLATFKAFERLDTSFGV